MLYLYRISISYTYIFILYSIYIYYIVYVYLYLIVILYYLYFMYTLFIFIIIILLFFLLCLLLLLLFFFFSISLHCLLVFPATLHLSTSTGWLEEISSRDKSTVVNEISKCMFYYVEFVAIKNIYKVFFLYKNILFIKTNKISGI